MHGYIPIEIPTKSYIKAFIISQLGKYPKMLKEHPIGNKFFDVLQHKTNERRTEFANKRYDTTIKVYVSYYFWRQRGAFLNETNIKSFNLYLEKEIKWKMRHYLDFYIEMLPSFEAHLPEVRRKLGIDVESWSDDSMQKDYYRYRKTHKKGRLFYGKQSSRSVPTENVDNLPF